MVLAPLYCTPVEFNANIIVEPVVVGSFGVGPTAAPGGDALTYGVDGTAWRPLEAGFDCLYIFGKGHALEPREEWALGSLASIIDCLDFFSAVASRVNTEPRHEFDLAMRLEFSFTIGTCGLHNLIIRILGLIDHAIIERVHV